jgi:hypothetical protein
MEMRDIALDARTRVLRRSRMKRRIRRGVGMKAMGEDHGEDCGEDRE